MGSAKVALIGAVLALCGCATSGQNRPTAQDADAVVRVEGKSGSSISGTGGFRKDGIRVQLSLSVENAPPGLHAVHLHENGDCSAPDAASAGDHWNPTESPHGQLNHAPAHLGDIGNLTVDADGTGRLEFTTEKWTLGTGEINDVLGKSLVIHANTDDFVTQPTGNAGGRIGCGVVRPSAPPVARR
jgi:Cu-Zn family superoxide dismutase